MSGGCPFNQQRQSPPPATAQQQMGVSPESPGANLTGSNLSNDSLNMLSTVNVLGFETTRRDFVKVPEPSPSLGPADPAWHQAQAPEPTHYSSYLAVERLLKLQEGEAGSKPDGKGMMHHEELTFIIVHQVFELWFKLVTADLTKAHEFMREINAKDLSFAVQHDRMTHCVSYLRRAELIFHHVQGAFGVMESMHPGDFIEFRDFLVPASGFQSVGFRSLEQLLGVPNAGRQEVNGASVFTYLKPEEQEKLALERKIPSINVILLRMCGSLRIPEGFVDVFLHCHRRMLEEQQYKIAQAKKDDRKAAKYVEKGVADMKAILDDPVSWSDGLFLENSEDEELYKKAVLGALLAITYRHDPRYSLLAQLLDQLIALEEGLMLWRSRHSHMAERMIGRRSGTGGSSGVGYLDITRRYRVFHSLWLVRKVLTRSSAMPPLSSFDGFPESSLFVADNEE